MTREDKTTRLTFKIDAAKRPKAFDLVSASGRVRLGIYKVEDDKLTLAFMEPDVTMPEERPADFSTGKSRDKSVFIYQRAQR